MSNIETTAIGKVSNFKIWTCDKTDEFRCRFNVSCWVKPAKTDQESSEWVHTSAYAANEAAERWEKIGFGNGAYVKLTGFEEIAAEVFKKELRLNRTFFYPRVSVVRWQESPETHDESDSAEHRFDYPEGPPPVPVDVRTAPSSGTRR